MTDGGYTLEQLLRMRAAQITVTREEHRANILRNAENRLRREERAARRAAPTGARP